MKREEAKQCRTIFVKREEAMITNLLSIVSIEGKGEGLAIPHGAVGGLGWFSILLPSANVNNKNGIII